MKRSTAILVKLTPDEKNRLKTFSKESGVSISKLVRSALNQTKAL